jgi:hypothetical protein
MGNGEEHGLLKIPKSSLQGVLSLEGFFISKLA